MKINAAIILIAIMLIGFIAVKNSIRIEQEVKDIDYLQEAADLLKKHCAGSKNIYYVANNNAIDLYYKTQFAFAPFVVIKSDYNTIPLDSLVIVSNYSSVTEPNNDFANVPADATVVQACGNAFLKISLQKKK